MAVSSLTLLLFALVLSTAALTGGDARTSRYRPSEIPTERQESSSGGSDGGGGKDSGGHGGYAKRHGYGYGGKGKKKSEDCVSIRPAYHSFYKERVAQCDALLDLQNSTSEFQSSVNESLTVISSELESLEMRLSQAEVDIDDLQGIGKNVIRLSLNIGGSFRRLCEINSYLEAAELCRVTGTRIPNPFFFHLPCTDSRVRAVEAGGGNACLVGSQFWRLQPGCVSVNTQNIFGCFQDPPPGARCDNLVFLSCQGYATGSLLPDPSSLQSMEPMQMALNKEP